MMKRITIKEFESVKEVSELVEIHNNLVERSILDHDELADLKSWIEIYHKNRFQSEEKSDFMIINEFGDFIGTIGYKQISSFDYAVGYRLFRKKHRGLGYMTEALEEFVRYLFETKETLMRLTIEVNQLNIPSMKVAEKCGFKLEGVKRKAYMLRGKLVDFHQYGLLRKEI